MKNYKYYTKRLCETSIVDGRLYIDTSKNEEISGAYFNIDDNFRKTFRDMFGISSKKKQDFDALYDETVADLEDTAVFYTVDDTVFAIFQGEPIPPIWIDKIEKWCQVRFGLDSTFVYRNILSTHVVVFQPSKFRAYSGDGGIFRFGWCIEIPHDGSNKGKLSRALQRVKSKSVSILSNKKYASTIDYDRTAAEAINDTLMTLATSINSRHIEVKKELALRMRAQSSVQASLQELINASDKIARNVPSKWEHRLWDVIRPLMLDETLLAYQLGGYEEKSRNWRRSARTPIMKIDVFNLLAEIGTNFQNLDLQFEAGDSLTTLGDLEDIAPYVNWPTNDRSNSKYLVNWSRIQ